MGEDMPVEIAVSQKSFGTLLALVGFFFLVSHKTLETIRETYRSYALVHVA